MDDHEQDVPLAQPGDSNGACERSSVPAHGGTSIHIGASTNHGMQVQSGSSTRTRHVYTREQLIRIAFWTEPKVILLDAPCAIHRVPTKTAEEQHSYFEWSGPKNKWLKGPQDKPWGKLPRAWWTMKNTRHVRAATGTTYTANEADDATSSSRKSYSESRGVDPAKGTHVSSCGIKSNTSNLTTNCSSVEAECKEVADILAKHKPSDGDPFDAIINARLDRRDKLAAERRRKVQRDEQPATTLNGAVETAHAAISQYLADRPYASTPALTADHLPEPDGIKGTEHDHVHKAQNDHVKQRWTLETLAELAKLPDPWDHEDVGSRDISQDEASQSIERSELGNAQKCDDSPDLWASEEIQHQQHSLRVASLTKNEYHELSKQSHHAHDSTLDKLEGNNNLKSNATTYSNIRHANGSLHYQRESSAENMQSSNNIMIGFISFPSNKNGGLVDYAHDPNWGHVDESLLGLDFGLSSPFTPTRDLQGLDF